MSGCHGVSSLILDLLNDRLGLPPGTLTGLHKLNSTSGDQVRWINAPPQPPHDRGVAFGQHTDFGSVCQLRSFLPAIFNANVSIKLGDGALQSAGRLASPSPQLPRMGLGQATQRPRNHQSR